MTDFRALCSEPLAQKAYVAFVQICKGGSDNAGTYDADEEIVRRALKRLHELESAAMAEPEPQRRCIYSPVQIAECGGPCEQGPEYCDCGELCVTEPAGASSPINLSPHD